MAESSAALVHAELLNRPMAAPALAKVVKDTDSPFQLWLAVPD